MFWGALFVVTRSILIVEPNLLFHVGRRRNIGFILNIDVFFLVSLASSQISVVLTVSVMTVVIDVVETVSVVAVDTATSVVDAVIVVVVVSPATATT